MNRFRITAQVLLFVKRLRRRQHLPPTVTVGLLNEAENLWVHAAQVALKAEAQVSLEAQLGLFTDSKGLVRCTGRLQNTDIPYVTQFPLISPRNHQKSTRTDLPRWCKGDTVTVTIQMLGNTSS